ncbi:MAG: Slp family lipoprotein [Gammaproteobacteria bacterium]
MYKLLLSISLLLTACSNAPKSSHFTPEEEIRIDQVRGNVASFLGKQVRWGGTIIEVQNEQEFTRIQLMYYPPGRDGRPDKEQPNLGRFVVHTAEFLDPAVYAVGKPLNVLGRVGGEIDYRVGNKLLKLPLIQVDELYLWPPEVKYRSRDFYNCYPYDCGYYPFRYYRGWYPYRYNYYWW